jgi:hypothetical protein
MERHCISNKIAKDVISKVSVLTLANEIHPGSPLIRDFLKPLKDIL